MKGTLRMEEIMAIIKHHIKDDPDPATNGHRYNRVWEAIDKWHNKWKDQGADDERD